MEIPPDFDPKKLEYIDFGDPDGAHDALIKEQMCICHIRPMREFLKDKKSILLGEKGSGKTCLFELVREGKIEFTNQKKFKLINVAINEQLSYKSLREQIINKITTKIKDESLKYRLVWELYIIHIVLEKLKELDLMSTPLRKISETLDQAFGNTAKTGILNFLFSQKKKIGVKFGVDVSGMPTADAYAALEADNVAATVEQIEILRLADWKQAINSHLEEQKIAVYILIDRIDEFVIREEYEVQKLTLQGLLGCEQSYLQYSNLRLKLFLRLDLFEKMDLREFGADKIDARCTEIKWTPQDIHDLIAKRIIRNYFGLFEKSSFQLEINEEMLYVDKDSNPLDDDNLKSTIGSLTIWTRKIKNLFTSDLKHRYRHTNFNEQVSLEIIKTFFPTEVTNPSAAPAQDQIGIQVFIDNYFNLGSGSTTPRLIILFMQKCLDITMEYYQQNPDLVKVTTNPIIPKVCVSQAYAEFRSRLWTLMALETPNWKHQFDCLRTKMIKDVFLQSDIQEVCELDETITANEFVATLNHSGIVKCRNKDAVREQRRYEFASLLKPFGTDGTNY